MKYILGLVLAFVVSIPLSAALPVPVPTPPNPPKKPNTPPNHNHNNTINNNNTTVIINHNHPHFKQVGVVKYNWGYSYKGFKWNHWTHHKWFVNFGTFCYWNPHIGGWYYWCQPDECWYPVTYCPYGVYNWDDSPDLDP
jgi:hypothetical protein